MSESKIPAILIKDLRKTFDDKEFVLNGVNLEVPAGKITVLIGFSGTGKSVLLKHILGLLAPSSGIIEILGKNYQDMNQEEVNLHRRNFGMLFQNAALFDDMTTLENVCFPLYEHRRHLGHRKIRRMATERLELVGLDAKHYNKLPSQLSGGMRKRVGLARALALDPKILLYDEPTTGLDPVLTETVDNLIVKTHRHHRGATSVVVTHDLMAAFRIGDYVAMLDSGKILLYGTPQDFLDSDIELVRRFVSKGVKKGEGP